MLAIEQRLLDYIFVDEGGFANVKGDAGGKTRFGVTERLARAYHYTGPMEDLPQPMAASILLHEYWYSTWVKIEDREQLAIKLCDTQMNMPPAEGVKIAQRAANNVIRAQQTIAADPAALPSFLSEDGGFGALTMAALLHPLLPEESLLRECCLEQEKHYEFLEQTNANDVQFTHGWRNRAFRIPDGKGGATCLSTGSLS